MQAAPELRRGSLAFRPETIDDAEFGATAFTALYPDEPFDPVAYRWDWKTHNIGRVSERFVVMAADKRIGIAHADHPYWQEGKHRFGHVQVALLTESRTDDRLRAAFGFIEDRSRAQDTQTLVTDAYELDQVLIAFMKTIGYQELGRDEFRELDLRANQARLTQMAEASRRRMREQGIAILTLNQDGDPERERRLHEATLEAETDTPDAHIYGGSTFEELAAWLKGPSIHQERIWIAKLRGETVGVSFLDYPPVRGHVWTDWTGTKRAARGRGIARALKLETLMQAIELGVPKVRTGNHEKNAPILHLNNDLGYVQIPGAIQFSKPA